MRSARRLRAGNTTLTSEGSPTRRSSCQTSWSSPIRAAVARTHCRRLSNARPRIVDPMPRGFTCPVSLTSRRRHSWSVRWWLQPQTTLVVLDLRELTFMDSSGLHAIVDASMRARPVRPPAVSPAWAADGPSRVRPDREPRRRRNRRCRLTRAARPGALMRVAVVQPAVPETLPIPNETLERVVRAVAFGVPLVALGLGCWLAWGGTPHWHDLVVLAITYTLTVWASRWAFTGC